MRHYAALMKVVRQRLQLLNEVPRNLQGVEKTWKAFGLTKREDIYSLSNYYKI